MHIIDPDLTKQKMDEYLRRNLLHAASCGAEANARAARDRLMLSKKQPKWLVELLDGIIDRAHRVSKEMAAHRDEIEIYVPAPDGFR